MKHPLEKLLGIALMSALIPVASADPLFWNAAGTGGDGNWGTSPGERNWNTVFGAPAGGNLTWPDDEAPSAVFSDALGGTVTLIDQVELGGIRLDGASYQINGGMMRPEGPAGHILMNVQSGVLSIDSIITGGGDLTKDGPGRLTLQAPNTSTGAFSVLEGSVDLQGSLANTGISIASGADFINTSGGLSANPEVTNAGTLTMFPDDTIASYTSNGGLLDGSGLLTVTGAAALNDGSTVAGSLEAESIASNGMVRISGSASAPVADVQTGTLTLTGTLDATDLGIASGAAISNESGGLADTTVLANAGTLTMGADDTIAGYTSNGGVLDGSGLLTVTGAAALNDGSTVAGSLEAESIASNGMVRISGSASAPVADVQTGTLILTGTLDAAELGIAAGATLSNQSGGLADTTMLTNAGTLAMGTDDAIAGYTSNGGLLDGSGLLTVTGAAALNDGSSVAGSLGAGSITSNGAVQISGSASAPVAAVQTGTLILTGTLDATELGIASGAALSNESGGLADTTVLTNAGTLAMGADDSIASYTSNGGLLDGSGMLTVNGAAVLNDGSSVAGSLGAESIASNGMVRISGSASAPVADVQTGTLSLTGTLDAADLGIASGATLSNESGGLADTTVLTNAGTLAMGADDSIASYTSNGGLLDGSGLLTVSGATALNDGSTVAGSLGAGSIASNGAVQISGSASAPDAAVQTGTLTLTGTLDATDLGIAAGAALANQSGGLADTTMLTNAGTLAMGADDTIAGYTSNGGLLDGSGLLTVSGATALNDGSTVAGSLQAESIASNGMVRISGSASAPVAAVQTGTLTLTGTLDAADLGIAAGAVLNNQGGALTATSLDIAGGGRLVAGGMVDYGTLTTSGSGAGVWQGDLVNRTVVSPGGGAFGILEVTGDMENTQAGVMRFDLSAAGNDLMRVGGAMSHGGTLDLRLAAGGHPEAFTPVQLIEAGSYSGNIDALTSDLDAPVWFNPGDGTVSLLDVLPGGELSRLSQGRLSAFLALYEDVVDPGVTNVSDGPPLALTSGIASMDDPALMWTLAATMASGGVDEAVLNRLSPGVYGAFGSHAMQATRHHQRTAMSARGPAPVDSAAPAAGAKSGAKEPAGAGRELPGWVAFAAADHMHARARGIADEGGYSLNGTGFLVGTRGTVRGLPEFVLYLAGHNGRVSGDLLRADVDGVSLGAVAEWQLPVTWDVTLTSALSFGRYQFDGSRTTVAAGPGGWAPAQADFDGVTAHSVEWFTGVVGSHELNPAVRLAPAAGLRFASGSMRGFGETTGPSGVSLDVRRDDYHALLLESGLTAEADVHERATLLAETGFTATLHRSGHGMSATLTDGGRPVRADLGGISEDTVFLGLGLAILAREDVMIRIGGRAERRGSGDRHNSGFISVGARF